MKHISQRRVGLSLCAAIGCAIVFLAAAQSASAATITVQSLSGASDGAVCTLRDAITAANLDRATGGCPAGSGDDIIVLAVEGTINLTSALPLITTSVNILGPGPSALTIQRNPLAAQFRLLDINAVGAIIPDVTVSGVRMVNGNPSSGNGGAIQARNYSRLTVVNAVFENNAAQNGGAIHIRGPLTVENSVFVNNSATNAGGAAFTDLDTVIVNSVFIGNAAYGSGSSSLGGGGAVRLNIGPNWVYNSVFARNTIVPAAVGGAAIRISALNPTSIVNTTIVGSDALNPQSAIYSTSGGGNHIYITNTIITSHTIGIHRGGTIPITQDYNLFFGNTTNVQGIVGGGANSITGDPLFVDPVANNYRLSQGSPAIDVGTAAGVINDLDGVSRPQDAGFDIGAYEYVTPPPSGQTIAKSALPASGSVVLAGSRITYTIVVSAPAETALTNLLIMDPIPANTTLVPGSALGTGVVIEGNPVVMSQPSVQAGGAATLTFSVEVNGNLAQSALISNAALVQAEEIAAANTNAVTHEARVPAAIIVTLAPAELSVDGAPSAAITATVVDGSGKPVPGIATAGEIGPASLGAVSGFGVTDAEGRAYGVWTAGTVAGSGSITVAGAGLTGTAAITLLPGALTTITVSPAVVTAQALTSVQFTAAGTDQYGNAVAISPVWSVNRDAIGAIDANGLFTAPAGLRIVATHGSVSGSATVYIAP